MQKSEAIDCKRVAVGECFFSSKPVIWPVQFNGTKNKLEMSFTFFVFVFSLGFGNQFEANRFDRQNVISTDEEDAKSKR